MTSTSPSHFSHSLFQFLDSASLLLQSHPSSPPLRQEKSNDFSTTASDKIILDEQSELQTQAQAQSEEKEADSSTDVASELKQMLRERKEGELKGDNLLIGVTQEVRGIEWPDLGNVVGTTGIVLAVIVGPTAALLSVNGILAELSDRLFDGRIRIQDFF